MRDMNHKQFGEFLDMQNEQLQINLVRLKKEKARRVGSQRRAIEKLLNEDICLWRSSDKNIVVTRSPDSNGIPFEITQKLFGKEINHKFQTFSEAVDTANWLCNGKGNYIAE